MYMLTRNKASPSRETLRDMSSNKRVSNNGELHNRHWGSI